MRKILTFIAGTIFTGTLFAGGLVTNTNQSALYTRLQSRNASTSIDAVYFNPAGLTKLGTGFFASINNQTIGQTKTVKNDYLYLSGSPKEYIGKVSAPIFPGVYVAYNIGNFSFSGGLNPIGGGGGAKYATGLPSFEMQIADLIPLLNSKSIPTTAYSADIFFEGTSVYMGYQINAAYKINDMLSIGAGVRMVTAKNTYLGHMTDISINPNYPAFGATYNGSSMVPANEFFTAGATTLNGLATAATGYSAVIGGRLAASVPPGTLLSDGPTNGLNGTEIGTIQQLMGAAGQTPAQIGAASIGYAQAVLNGAAPVFTANATAMTGYSAATSDIEVDASQKGTGYSPILSVNFSPSEQLNIAVKYEFQTKLELTTSVVDNKGAGIFIDGETSIADMPAMLATGIEYKPMDKLLLSGSMNVYFDNNVDYDGSATENVNMIAKNFTEYAFGAEYAVTDQLRASAGWLGTFTGVNSNYQNDQRYSLNTNSFGAGVGYRVNDMIDVNLGGQYTFYKEGTKAFNRILGPTTAVPIIETYNKNTWVVAIGVDLYFGK